jgi:hypothetical protein
MNTPHLTYPASSSHKQNWFQPSVAWIFIILLIIASIIFSLAGAGKIVRIFFPIGSFCIGLLLYTCYPVMYVGFTWWIWMLTPFIARLADYHSGWDPQRLMMVATYLVTLIPLVTIVKHSPRFIAQGAAPFVVSSMAILYGVVIGLLHSSPYTVARNFLDWASPIVFGLYLFSRWPVYPALCKNIQNVFLWGVGITGAYGVYQYFVAPEWDRFWLIESGMYTSSGNPEPFGIRVWSTMHSPGPFAAFITAGLLILFSSKSKFVVISNLFGYTSFLLTLVRTAWGSWLIGLFFLISSVKSGIQLRLISYVVVMTSILVPIVSMSPFISSIMARLSTLTNLSQDDSFNVRQGIYESSLNTALTSFVGNGIGGAWTVNDGTLKQIIIDSGIIDVLLTLGWVGSIPYFAGLTVALIRVLSSPSAKFDSFLSASRSISISCFLQMIMGTSVIGLPGLLVWSFLGISLAGDKYYQTYSPSQSNSVDIP